jgi:hypothetical protein
MRALRDRREPHHPTGSADVARKEKAHVAIEKADLRDAILEGANRREASLGKSR